MSAWAAHSFNDLVKFRNGKSTKGLESGSYPIYGSNGIIGSTNQYMYENAIILGRVGAYCGSVAYCPGKFWATDNTIVVEPDEDLFDVKFAGFLLGSADLNRYAGGSAQPIITQTNLKGLSFHIPPLKTQRRIASILGAYDDLIEVNRRRIKVLEEMARGLFEEWFVRFRFPGHENVPILDTPDGPLPEGWVSAPLGSFFEYSIGGLWGEEKPTESKTQNVSVIRGTDFPRINSGNFGTIPVRCVSEKEMRSRRLREKDIVLEASGGSKDQPVGRVIYVAADFLSQFTYPVAPASFCRLLRPRSQEGLGLYTFCLLQRMYDDRRIEKFQKQSTGLRNLSTKILFEEPVVLPDASVLREFGKLAQPLLEAESVHRRECSVLAAARDLLLPRLISGQLSVETAEQIPEAAE